MHPHSGERILVSIVTMTSLSAHHFVTPFAQFANELENSVISGE